MKTFGPAIGGTGGGPVMSSFHRIDLFTAIVYARRKRLEPGRSKSRMIAFRHGFRTRQEAITWGHEWGRNHGYDGSPGSIFTSKWSQFELDNRRLYSIKASLEVK